MTDETKKEIERLVFVALGAASTCWENMSGTGEFNSTRAKEIGEDVCGKIFELIEAQPFGAYNGY